MKNLSKRIMYKIMDMVNCIAIGLTAYSANLACDWLYYQEEEPEEVKKMRKF